ncbi:MAG TPA: hypothetical protein VD995_19460 [Azospirillum sp.]|nr:hypothetical protein [Azospirillum sp.]
MRAILPLTVAALLLAAPAIAPAFAQDQQKQTLTTDPNVQQSQQPHPTPQGTRPPTEETAGDTGAADLQQALAAVRRAPPDLQGNPVPRPNPLASEPDNSQEPSRSANPSDLSSQEVK